MSSRTVPDMLAALAARGLAVSVSPARTLLVRPSAALTSADRAWLRAHAGAAVEHLAPVGPRIVGAEPWDARVLGALVACADALAEQLQVSGLHQAVRAAAEAVASAWATGDAETVRFAVSEFRATVQRVAAERAALSKSQHLVSGTGPLPNGRMAEVSN